MSVVIDHNGRRTRAFKTDIAKAQWMNLMNIPHVALTLAIALAVPLGRLESARSVNGASAGDESPLSFARIVAVQALTFHEGDRRALARVKQEFTPDGWQQFLKGLRDWLDSNDTPTFGSSFAPSSEGRVVEERDGLIHVRIPGSLTQTHHQSTTTYRVAAADVWVGGTPLKVHRLTQTTCKGASVACQ